MKSKNFLALVLLTGALLFAVTARARIIGTNPTGTSADLWCNGGRIRANTSIAYTEVCQDYLGDLIPTSTSGTQYLGTSALPWLGLYSGSIVNSGAQATGAAGTILSGGASGTAASQFVNSGLTVYSKVAITGIRASTTIPVIGTYETLMSTDSATVSITATPSISTLTIVGGVTPLTSGTYLILSSTGPSGVIFTDDGTLSGSKLELGASTRTVTQFDTLTLIWDATSGFWHEISYSNN